MTYSFSTTPLVVNARKHLNTRCCETTFRLFCSWVVLFFSTLEGRSSGLDTAALEAPSELLS